MRQIQKVFLTGATGFVGQVVLKALQKKGYLVRCLLRPESREETIQGSGVEGVKGNILEASTLQGRVVGCQAVIHLVGIIQPYRENTFERVHVQGTQNILQAAQEAHVEKFVHMSALGTRPNGESQYHKTKWVAEEAVRSSGLPYTIFRPSIIFGYPCAFIETLIGFLKALVVPVAGNGKNRFQPVSVEDVSRCFLRALTEDYTDGKTFELGGPGRYSFDELLDLIAFSLRGKTKPKFHVPLPFMRFLAFFFEFLPHPPVIRDQLVMLKEDNVVKDPQETEKIFGPFQDFSSWVKTLPQLFSPHPPPLSS